MPSPQRVSWAKLRVTAVSLVSLLILFTLFYLLTGGSLLSQKAILYLYLTDGSGLERDAPVRVDGVDVGTVKAVRLFRSPNPARTVQVVMEIDRYRLAGIPTNSEAEISSDSIIGDAFVDVTSHPAPESVRPGGEIPLKKPAELMKAIDILALEKQLRQFNAVVGDLDAGRGPVGQFVRGRKMYDDLLKRSAEIERALRAAVSTTTAVGKAVYQDESYRKLSDSAARLDASLADLQSGENASSLFLRDDAGYVKWRDTLVGIRESIAALRGGPMIQSGDVYAGWSRSLATLIRQVDDFNATPALNTPAAYESLSGAALELRDSVREIRTHPEKFLRMKVF